MSTLYDYATGESLGAATAEQAEASRTTGPAAGALLIDATGKVIAQHDAHLHTARAVYVDD